jgi:hypothetical protein
MRFSEAHIVILCESSIEICGLTIEISVNLESLNLVLFLVGMSNPSSYKQYQL